MNMRCDKCRREVEFTRENSQLYWYVCDYQYNHLSHTCKCEGKLLYFMTPDPDFWENIPRLIEGGWSIKVLGQVTDDVKKCLDTTNAHEEQDKQTQTIFNRILGENHDPLD